MSDEPYEPTLALGPIDPPAPVESSVPPAEPGPRPTWTPPAPPEVPDPLVPVPVPPGRPGWRWPAVAALALVLGLGGGLAGSAIYDRLDSEQSADEAGQLSGGLVEAAPVSTPPLEPGEATVANVAAELLPSTVQISAEYGGEAGGATGSGFVLDSKGHVITNNHVVEEAAQDDGPIEIVDQDGNRYAATVVGRSPVYDLAVLYAADAKSLKPTSLGASRALRVGEQVVAIGSPLGLTSTVTAGIVSALQRPVTTGNADASSYINAVQTDAAINPGNSGGPLVNLLGQVVGVNSAIATSGGGFGTEAGNIGVGFAIPIEQVKVTADQILRTGEASYPVIGAQVQTGGAESQGALIDSVVSGQPAQKAGLEKGDIVIRVEGERVTDGIALIVAIRAHQPGETLSFTVRRNGQERTFDV
ncbi:S1C family serine protease, partial [Nocardioides sp.]|uniref:S1C family serine protease n=1 Tax=Nocardioides sp. TaxID=35761 RepID=UPI00356705B9